jgi:hypothetical protein
MGEKFKWLSLKVYLYCRWGRGLRSKIGIAETVSPPEKSSFIIKVLWLTSITPNKNFKICDRNHDHLQPTKFPIGFILLQGVFKPSDI